MTGKLRIIVTEIENVMARNDFFESALGSSLIRASMEKVAMASDEAPEALLLNLTKLAEHLRLAQFGASRGVEIDLREAIKNVDRCLEMLAWPHRPDIEDRL